MTRSATIAVRMLVAVVLGSRLGLAVAAATNTASHAAGKSVQDISFVIFDLETTGLSPAKDRVIELAAIRVQGGQIKERQSWLINPGIPIPPASERIHGLSSAMVAAAPAFPQVYTQFVAFVQDGVLLSHNARFDRRFMLAELDRHNLATPGTPLFDTLRLFKRWFPGRRSYSLEALTKSLCPLMPPAESAPTATNSQARNLRFHCALQDAECTVALFLKALGTLPKDVPWSEFEPNPAKRLILGPDPESKDLPPRY